MNYIKVFPSYFYAELSKGDDSWENKSNFPCERSWKISERRKNNFAGEKYALLCSSLSGLCREKGEEKANSNVQFSLYFREKTKKEINPLPATWRYIVLKQSLFLMLSAFLQLKSDLAETFWKGAQYPPPHTLFQPNRAAVDMNSFCSQATVSSW